MPARTDVNRLRAMARNLALMAFDVDGIFTDGRLHYGPDGELMKSFHTLDGHGIKKLIAAGVTVAVITGRQSAMVTQRTAELGIVHVIQGREDKQVALQTLAETLGLSANQVGYAGDDEPDVPALEWAGLSFSVPNAHACARQSALMTTLAQGGMGAVREMCDFILTARQRRY